MGTRKRLIIFLSLPLALFLAVSQPGIRRSNEAAQPAGASRSNPVKALSPHHFAEEAASEEDRLPEALKRFYELDSRSRRVIMKQAYEDSRRRALRSDSSDAAWVSLGPTNGAGKMNALAFDPANTDVIYAGADFGGIWKSTDAGASWFPLTDGIPAASVSSLAIAPSSPNILYAGISGAFIKSTDAGATWTFPPMLPGNSPATAISVSPNDPQDLVVGLYGSGAARSTDGGNTWSQVISYYPYLVVFDLARDPQNPATLYASAWRNRVLKSTDDGVSWVEKDAGLPFDATGQRWNARLRLAIAPSDPNIVYASTIEDQSDPSVPSHIFKTTDAGDSWADLPSVAGSSKFSISHFLSNNGVNQASRNSAIVVSPSNPNVVLAGGVAYVRSTDGGASWQEPAFAGDGIHVDVVAMKYQGSTLWIANDGGIWSSPDNGESTVMRNSNLVTREVYALAANPLAANLLLSGSQDNGSCARPTDTTRWEEILGGDGFECAINSLDPSIGYVTQQYGHVFRTSMLDTSFPEFKDVSPPYASGESVPFGTLLRMDPQQPSTLYMRSTNRIWRTTDSGGSWQPLGKVTSDGSVWDASRPVLDLAIAPSDSSVLMVVVGGSGSPPNDIFRSTDSGATWVNKGETPDYLSGVQIDPVDPMSAYAIGYVDVSTNLVTTVYATTDGGANWLPKGDGLPPVPKAQVRPDPADSNTLYCDTFAGIYRSTDKGASWGPLGTGFPYTAVTDMSLSDDGAVLRVATFGRGVWQIQVHPPLPPKIASATVAGKQLILAGAFFDAGASVLLNGQRQKTRNDPEHPRTQLVAKKAGLKVKAGDILQVRNADGTLSNQFQFGSGQ